MQNGNAPASQTSHVWRVDSNHGILNLDKGHGMTRKGDDLMERLLEFAARIGKVVDALPDSRLGRHVASQLVRCGTSPLPNYAEAGGAESRRDFAHKLSICLKELRETRCWILLIVKAELLPEHRLADLADECLPLMNIIAKPMVTTKSTMARAK